MSEALYLWFSIHHTSSSIHFGPNPNTITNFEHVCLQKLNYEPNLFKSIQKAQTSNLFHQQEEAGKT